MKVKIYNSNWDTGLQGRQLEPVRYLPKHIITQADVDEFMPAQW